MTVSLRDCINRFCMECRSEDIFAIANCDKELCPLYPARPNQSLLGKTPDDYEFVDLSQEVLDAMTFTGLREKEHVPL
jgi:hypothetical protein